MADFVEWAQEADKLQGISVSCSLRGRVGRSQEKVCTRNRSTDPGWCSPPPPHSPWRHGNIEGFKHCFNPSLLHVPLWLASQFRLWRIWTRECLVLLWGLDHWAEWSLKQFQFKYLLNVHRHLTLGYVQDHTSSWLPWYPSLLPGTVWNYPYHFWSLRKCFIAKQTCWPLDQQTDCQWCK